MATLRGFILFIMLGSALAEFKRWKPSMNFDEPSNWNVGRLPCSQDTVVLPEGLATVYVQTNTTVSEIVFPRNGQIVLGSFVSIGAPVPGQQLPQEKSGCKGQDVQFTRTTAESWFDPNNWCSAGDLEGHCRASQPAVLETERVPCKYEAVTFPVNHHFLVDLGSGVDLYMSDLFLSGQHYTTGSFLRFLSSSLGQQQFQRADGDTRTTINIKDGSCDDESGCACGNDRGTLADMICLAYNSSCQEPLCANPIEATGGCCGICGSVLELEYLPDGFRMDTFRGMVQKKYLNDLDDSVHSIISKTSLDLIQVVLMDSKGGQQAMQAGDRLQQDLVQNGDLRQRYGVSNVFSYTSSKEEEIQPQKHVALSNSQWGGVIIAIIIIIAIIGLVVFFVVYRRNRPPPKLELPATVVERFRSLRRGRQSGELELSKREPSVAYNDIALGFDNPVYDTANPLDANGDPTNGNVVKDAPPPVAQLPVTDGGFDNPLYGQGPVQNAVAQLPVTDVGFDNPLYGQGPVQDTSAFEELEDSSMDVTDDLDPPQGIVNPLYSGVEEIAHHPAETNGSAGHVNGTYLHLNPAFTADGVEDDTDV